MKKDSKFIKIVKQKIYSWHRTLGIITVIPVILWTLSGLTHPFMAHFFKPSIANEYIEVKPIDKSQMSLSIQEVLKQNVITEFKNFRIVSFNNVTFYQVKTIKDELLYFDTKNATKLENGDEKYAHWLSRYFLDDQKNSISKTEIITEFTSQYKYINRYLPVYKITFDRPDGMEVYVETVSSKLATFNPKSRQVFIWFFDMFHNWAFIDAITNSSIRIVLMLILLSIISFSAISGIIIYGLFWKQFKKNDSIETKTGLRKYHRQIGIWISLFTIMFAFSGGYHATTKWKSLVLDKMVYEPIIAIDSVKIPNNSLALDWKRVENSGLISYQDQLFYRFVLTNKEKSTNTKLGNNFKVGKKETLPSEIVYINAQTSQLSSNLDFEYAQFLSSRFSTNCEKSNCCEMDSKTEQSKAIDDYKIIESKVLTDFDRRDYGFVNKRLPVVKLSYNTPDKTTYYIEIATSRLAAKIENSDRLEGYSFAFLHKFLFMDWAGKNIRDLVTVLAALSVLIVSLMGLFLFLKKK